MKTFRLPDLGEGLQEAQVVQWHARQGDEIAVDTPLVSVETDKAVTEVPAPWSGRISRLCAEVGEIVKVGAPIVEFEGSEPDAAALHSAASAPATVVHQPTRSGKTMPAVRVLARELGLDLGAMTGSGPNGATLARDLADALKNTSVAVQPSIEDYATLTGIRRTMAQNMARAGREVVAATVHEEADLGDWPSRSGLTVRLVRAIARSVAAEPMLNASFDKTNGLQTGTALHLGIAVDSPGGLIVPVLRDAGTRAAETFAAELERLITAARSGRLKPDEMKGATFTLSNFGMIGGLHATPVVIPPQLAILGAGRLADRVVARRGAPVIRPILPLSLTYDHRFITGGEGARFIRALIADLEAPQ
jgi:pyruvate dehydrogenase E2 component (dihydrolipoamide acetyltransferase)